MPDFSTLSLRQETLKVNIPNRGSDGSLQLLVAFEPASATGSREPARGIKVDGEGEWNARKHGGSKRRVWRKIHIGIDEKSLEIRAAAFTTSDVEDAPIPTPREAAQLNDRLHAPWKWPCASSGGARGPVSGKESVRGSAVVEIVHTGYRMLSNRAYLGEAVHKGESYPGEHDAIIDRETWDRVHAILQESPRKRAARTRADTPALLKGLLFGPDGAAFSPTHTRKGDRLYRYYVSQTVLKHGAGSCPIGRVPAGEIEATVIDQLRAVFRQPEIIAGTCKAARADASITEADARAALQQLDPLWDELFPAEQSRIVALLVERVDIGIDGLNVRLRVDGLGGLAHEMLAGGIGEAA